jgi:hypothetical protein
LVSTADLPFQPGDPIFDIIGESPGCLGIFAMPEILKISPESTPLARHPFLYPSSNYGRAF